MNSEPKNTRGWRITRRILIGMAIVATVFAIFYTEEDWRGKAAWEQQKHNLEAKGAVLDWDKYIPPAVPDDENFYTANTNIALRFVKARTEAQSAAASRSHWLNGTPWGPGPEVAEVTVISPKSTAIPADADLYLRYDHSVLTIGKSGDSSEPQEPLEPVVVMNDLPLKDAIEKLAREAKLNCTIDSKVNSMNSKGKPILISVRWEKVTARDALLALLDNYGLVLVENSKDGTARILPTTRGVYADPDVTKQINEVLSRAFGQSTNGLPGFGLKGAQGLWLFADSLHPVKPARIVLWAHRVPGTNVIREICSQSTVIATGTNSFSVRTDLSVMSAEDYLKWSDQYEPAFDEIREALKRPYATIPGDYSRPYLIPIPNFITMRFVAQTLAQRAQCDFLLNRPDQALRELALVHDICKILQKPPTGEPMTLVEAMIRVAIMGLYSDTISDGIRLNAWQEPQLAVLQAQLRETDVLPQVVDAFRLEQAATARTFETMSPSEIDDLFSGAGFLPEKKRGLRERLQDPLYLLLKFGPRGWVYENMVIGSGLTQKQIDCVDLSNRLISAKGVAAAADDVNHHLKRWSPENFIIAVGMPNFLKAWQVAAHNQAIIDEGQIACALERYRLANGAYPETLDALVPQFMEKLPHDIIGGGPLHYRHDSHGKFLLYSIGWNGTDDGGQNSASDKDNRKDYSQGDWVWSN